jgi:hypothetical protein
MRFYPEQHPFYCGIDLHARTMYLCILNQTGEILVHRNMPAGPDLFLKVIAPYREDLVVCVECIFTWYWLADLCAREAHPNLPSHAFIFNAYKNQPIYEKSMFRLLFVAKCLSLFFNRFPGEIGVVCRLLTIVRQKTVTARNCLSGEH